MQEFTAAAIERQMRAQSDSEGKRDVFPPLPGLPTARYYDREFHELEMKHLWPRTWLMVGHVSELPEPGSYKLFERVGFSVIITRGKGNAVRAFYNTCIHRGSALVTEPRGEAPRFVCPYHGWSYGPDGQLLAITDSNQFPCFDKSKMSLAPVRCEVWRGLIFINLDGKADPLADFLAPMAAQAEAFPFESFVEKQRRVFELDCNWKVPLDNMLETYHINTVHPQSITPFLDIPSLMVQLFPNGHSWYTSRKKASTIMAPSLTDHVDNVAGSLFCDYNICMHVFPNNYYVFDVTGFVHHTIWPSGPNKCIVDFVQMGTDSQSDEYFEELFWSSMEPIFQEDWRIFPPMQRSLENRALSHLNLGNHERGIYWLNEEIDRIIGQEHIANPLRVPEILAPHI